MKYKYQYRYVDKETDSFLFLHLKVAFLSFCRYQHHHEPLRIQLDDHTFAPTLPGRPGAPSCPVAPWKKNQMHRLMQMSYEKRSE